MKNRGERCEVVRAMETIARCVNDEDVFCSWLLCGVADGDIDYDTEDEDLEIYIQDDTLSELFDVFLKIMVRARKSGGLYVDGVCGGEKI